MSKPRRPAPSRTVADLRRRPRMADLLWRVAVLNTEGTPPRKADVVGTVAPATRSRWYKSLGDLLDLGLLDRRYWTKTARLTLTPAGQCALCEIGYLNPETGKPR